MYNFDLIIYEYFWYYFDDDNLINQNEKNLILISKFVQLCPDF